jgi:Tfp pilus assembly protein PilX
MKVFEIIRCEKGFALVLSLVVMSAMTAIGIAALTTSTTDMLIARNEKEAKTAFSLAETGIEEAVGRLDLSGTNARFAGENAQQRKNRRDGTPSFTNSDFDSTGLNLSETGGSYDVDFVYALEGTDTWCKPVGDCSGTPEIVLYGQDFGFSGTGVPATGFVPIYKIESTGEAGAGTSVIIRAYVAASTLNVVPPAGDIFSNSTIAASGASGINGSACGTAITSGCDPVANPNCTNACPTFPGAANMDEYLGINIDELKSYADVVHTQTGVLEVIYDDADLGNTTICSTSTTDIDAHICDNESKIIYIDNAGAGDAGIAGNTSGRGILVITGDLDVMGTLNWEGTLYVLGELVGAGNVNTFGTIMANDFINFTGNLTAFGSTDVATSVADSVGIPKMVRWSRR